MIASLRNLYKQLIPHETRLRLYKLRHQEEFRQLRIKVHPSAKGDFSLKPFDENKCIFVHVTKTAGTSVAKSLFGYLPYHYTAQDYRVIYGTRVFNTYFKFAFVRNPWDRLYSSYRYLMAGGWNDNDKKWAQENISQYRDFQDFVKRWLSEENLQKHVHFWPQVQFTCDRKNNLLIDYTGRFETLDKDFSYICQRLNIQSSLKSHNQNPGKPFQEVYDDDSRKIVQSVYADDIKLFAYDFENSNLPQRNSN